MSTPKRKKNIEMQEDKRQVNLIQKRNKEESQRLEDLDIRERPSRYKTSDVYENRIVGKRGFAAMDPERQREIASMGGRAAHERGLAHEFTSEEARRAGHLGGERTSESHEREFYDEIGHKAGAHRAETHGRGFYEELGHPGQEERRENLASQEYKKTLGRVSKASHKTREPETSEQRRRISYKREGEIYPESRQDEQRARKSFEFHEPAHASRYRFEEHPEERSSQFRYAPPRKTAREAEYEAIERETPTAREFEQEQNPSRSRYYSESRGSRHEYRDTPINQAKQIYIEERELEAQRRERAAFNRDEFETRPYARKHTEEFEHRDPYLSQRARESEENRIEGRNDYGKRIQSSGERLYRERNPEFRYYPSPIEIQRETSRERVSKSRRNPEYFENRYPSESEFQSRRQFYPNYLEEEWNENSNFQNEIDSEDYDLMEQEEDLGRKRYY